jgi:hypothetical protein
MRVRHFGNTANNAYYNARILAENEGIDSDLPISMFGLVHAISAPAWEVVEFEVPGAEWVVQPDWSPLPDAVAVNGEYTDLPQPVSPAEGSGAETLPRNYRSPTFLPGLRRWVNSSMTGKRWAQPLFDEHTRRLLAHRTSIPPADDCIDVLYGADSLTIVKPSTPARTVCLEHGTIRWIADGSPQLKVDRRAYREQVQRASHLWVTNLDPRTLEIAEDLMPGRWSALPHPYLPDPRAPYAETSRRGDLLRRTGTSALVLLPSSQNWGKHHDKGSMKALTAFVELRRVGVDVGLVAVEWGLQLAESKAFLAGAGVGANVAWVPPMPRLSMQRTMANVDVVWDQFGLEAFGGLAIRAVERLIGGPVPWRQAATIDDIVRETTQVLDEIAQKGRASVMEDYQTRYRAWFAERHSSLITSTLQREVYTAMLDGSFEQGTAAPDRWAQLVAEGLREDG